MNDKKTGEKSAKNKKNKPNKLFSSMNKMLDADLLESDLAHDMKKGARDFINSDKQNKSENTTLAKKMIQNLTDNLNGSFENNLGLSQKYLKCKTVTDFIEIQSKFFEHNYQTSVRTYTDLVHDIQQIINHNIKNTTVF